MCPSHSDSIVNLNKALHNSFMKMCPKQDLLGPQKPSSLKSLKIKPLPIKTRECAMKPLEMAYLSNSR